MPKRENQYRHFHHPSVVEMNQSQSPSRKMEKNGIEDITKEVALKMIPKKKVTGNDAGLYVIFVINVSMKTNVVSLG